MTRRHSRWLAAFSACAVILPAGARLRAAPAEQTQPSAMVALITQLEGNDTSARRRLEILHGLSPNISSTDAAALLAFAVLPKPDGLPEVFWHAIFNDIFDLLLRMKNLPGGTDRELIRAAAGNPDPVLRDYALQKLGHLMRRSSLPDALRANALEAVKNSAGTAGRNMQGTALLTWQRLETGPASSEFRKAVMACLQSSEATEPARTAAFQAGSAAGMRETAPAARQALQNPRSVTPLKLSAMAALAIAGTKEDAALLRSFLSDNTCRPAAQAALSKLGL